MTLYQHQINLLKKNPHKCLIAHDRGTGKTISALELCKQNAVKALIVVPKSIKQQWKDQVPTTYKVVTKEEFRRDWEKLGGYNALVIDESHWFAGTKSQMSKNLTKYLKRYDPKYVWLLTGTPYMNNVWSIYMLAQHLGHKWSYMTFKHKFFYDVRMGARVIPVQKKGIEKEVAQLLGTIGETVKLEDCIDLPEQIYETEYLELTKEQEKAISEITDTEHIVRWTKTHQLMGGTLKGDGYVESKIVKSNKIERLKELLEENPRSIVVCRYNNEIEVLRKELKDIIPIHVINGQVENREEIIKKLQMSQQYCLLVNSACSEGWELGDCPLMIFYSQSFSLKDQLQMEARIRRINKLKKNLYIFLVIKDSIDEDVFECLKAKSDFHIALYRK